mgnify:CR=1 FL=1
MPVARFFTRGYGSAAGGTCAWNALGSDPTTCAANADNQPGCTAASGAAVVLASGAKNKRFILPHARVMIHQPLGGYQGQASDIEIHTREILGIREKLNQILAHHTGQDVEKVAQDTDRDNFMSANKAKEYGLIDAVLDKRPTS